MEQTFFDSCKRSETSLIHNRVSQKSHIFLNLKGNQSSLLSNRTLCPRQHRMICEIYNPIRQITIKVTFSRVKNTFLTHKDVTSSLFVWLKWYFYNCNLSLIYIYIYIFEVHAHKERGELASRYMRGETRTKYTREKYSIERRKE
jgi:hypothetical protein